VTHFASPGEGVPFCAPVRDQLSTQLFPGILLYDATNFTAFHSAVIIRDVISLIIALLNLNTF